MKQRSHRGQPRRGETSTAELHQVTHSQHSGMTDAIISYVQLEVFDYFYFLILYSCSELRDIGMAYFLVYKQISLAYNLAGHRLYNQKDNNKMRCSGQCVAFVYLGMSLGSDFSTCRVTMQVRDVWRTDCQHLQKMLAQVR